MNEIHPPSEPDKEPPGPGPEPAQIYYQTGTPSKKLCAFLGFLIFLFSSALSFAFVPLCLVGLAVAIASLFFAGYRFIFVGYILAIGVLLLGTVIYCSTHPFSTTGNF